MGIAAGVGTALVLRRLGVRAIPLECTAEHDEAIDAARELGERARQIAAALLERAAEKVAGWA